ncbi:hypothetical protein [Cypionkella sp.]|uniref:hypothetical protein n=1 Tax=Cypionkella sp. TaxID=2811411 RepID=UPI002ABCCBFF|nr:hypothetical protein [Cypionkella sp.]MDZ4393805.1 hypothetical protein [Cypionkella sp.]
MHWLLIITLSIPGKTKELPWALTATADACHLTGTAMVLLLRASVPSLKASFTCAPEVRA